MTLEQQLEALSVRNVLVPCNPQGDAAKSGLQTILKSLQKSTLTDALRSSYSKEQLDELKEYAQREFDAMGQINRKRMESLVTLASDEMHNTMFEGLFLFDINQVDAPPMEVQERTKQFDEDGKPVMRTLSYPIFKEGAPFGIEGGLRFLPKKMCEGGDISIFNYLQEEYPEICGQFQQAQVRPIKALTTIGSLGGIGHKPDSDMDAQIIIDTNPEYDGSWNDGDFFIALVTAILNHFHDHYYYQILSPAEHKALKQEAVEALLEQIGEGLTAEEAKVADVIFESSFRKEVYRLIQERLQKLSPEEQGELFHIPISHTVREYPDCEIFLDALKQFFSFLKKESADDLRKRCFPFSMAKLSGEVVNHWMALYYREHFLGEESARLVLVQQGLDPKASGPQQEKALLGHLKNSQASSFFAVDFLEQLASRMASTYQGKLPEVVQLLQQHCGKVELPEEHTQKLSATLAEHFRVHMTQLAQAYSDFEAKLREVEIEFPIHQKVFQAEAYLTKKYPSTEIHFFTNILRRQRSGQHTPFLVSPEGSMAYSNMLNDFLLNPAVVLCGITSMPFDLPYEFQVLQQIGVFPEDEWQLTQTTPAPSDENGEKTGEDLVETFALRKLPSWGETKIPRKKFLEHATPIFLRESEKVSHRNLPKALLNCWWLEMIVCIDKEDDPPSSLTRLLWNPDQRYFVSQELEGSLVAGLRQIEADFPELPLDPWWLKFTEMLARFESYEQPEETEHDFELNTLSVTQKQIIFCFAQHIRISDIIDYGNDGKAIWIDDTVNWRTRALIAFYNLFFSDPEERLELIRFSQGRDDAGNRTEKILKKLFLESMQRTEKKLCSIGHTNGVDNIAKHLLKVGDSSADLENAKKFLSPLLAVVNQRVAIEDRKVLLKVKRKQPMNALEKMQARSIYQDHQKLKSVIGNVSDYFRQSGIELNENWVRRTIEGSKVQIAGDTLENVIFKYHFERNFERKPFQVPLPISKSLSIPRSRVKVDFNQKNGKWSFSSMLSRAEASGGGAGRNANTVMPMFDAHLVEGIARCVFSGYLGFSSRNLSSFEKPPATVRSEIATNPVTPQALFDLASEIREFFAPMHASSQELLENIHYLKDVFIACHVNRFNMLSLIIRDNMGEQFVLSFDIRDIKVPKIPPDQKMGHDEELPRFFLRLYSKQCRMLFLKYIAALKIPLLASHPPKLRIWVGHGKFDVPVAPKFTQVYINGVANTLWPHDAIGTREHLIPHPLSESFDSMGRRAVNELTAG